MYSDDGPDDDYMSIEQALDAGWLDPDALEDLRAVLAKVPLAAAGPDLALAALVAIDAILNPKPEIERLGPDLRLVWARARLGIEF